MEWIETSIPYAIAILAFSQWPVVWLVVVVVTLGSIHRARAAMTSVVLLWFVIALMLDADLVGPHLDFSNYGYVTSAAAIFATLAVLPRLLWPDPDAPEREPPRPVHRGALWLLAVGLLYGATLAVDLGLEALEPEPSDALANKYLLYLLLPALLAASWMARAAWLLVSPLLAGSPRLRRGVAVAAVAGWLSFTYEEALLPRSLSLADNFATADTDAPGGDLDCGTVTAYPERSVLSLQGGICKDTPAEFEAVFSNNPSIRRIALDSHGGWMAAAIELGERLVTLGFDARVDGQCSSACVTVFVGARQRWVGTEAWVGVHQTSSYAWAEGGRRVRWPLPPGETVLTFHQSRGVSPDLQARALQTPPDEIDYLNPEDIVAYGIAEIATVPRGCRRWPWTTTPPIS